MAKIVLSFVLFFGYVLQVNAALESSYKAVNQSDFFLTSIKPDFEVTGHESLNEVIKTVSQLGGQLSVGESHLQYKSATAINYSFIKTFLAASQKERMVFCAEKISHFLEPYGDMIKDQVSSYKVFTGNGPAYTDFKECVKDESKSHITYAGFFHQYPFAKDFLEFPRTPVVNQEGNNIRDQINLSNQLFITQVEMEYLEFSAFKYLLQRKITNTSEFREIAQSLINRVNSLSLQMKMLYETGNKFSAKKGVIVASSEFTQDLGVDQGYFIFTNLAYRSSEFVLRPLRSLLSLSDKELQFFLDRFATFRTHIVNSFIGPDETGYWGQMSYPRIERTFKGNTLFIQLRNAREDFLMAFEPDSDEFLCYDFISKTPRACFK